MTKAGRTRYDGVAMTLHWVTAVLMIFMLFFGEDLIRAGSASDAAALTSAGMFLPSLHVTIGVSVLVLTLARLAWRFANPPPPLPDTMAAWEVLLSKATHFLFYVAMICLPLTGWLSFAHYVVDRPVIAPATVFGLFQLPLAPDVGNIAGALHGLGGKATIALLILHVLAALKHQFIDHDDVLRRMSPG